MNDAQAFCFYSTKTSSGLVLYSYTKAIVRQPGVQSLFLLFQMTVRGLNRGDSLDKGPLSAEYTTEVGSSILFFIVVSMCEIQKLLVNILMSNSLTMHRDIFPIVFYLFLPYIHQNISVILSDLC